jgi:hypothetical protein
LRARGTIIRYYFRHFVVLYSDHAEKKIRTNVYRETLG